MTKYSRDYSISFDIDRSLSNPLDVDKLVLKFLMDLTSDYKVTLLNLDKDIRENEDAN